MSCCSPITPMRHAATPRTSWRTRGSTRGVAQLPFPLQDDEQLIAAVLGCVSARTRLALIDHVTSPTALVMPLARLVGALEARGIDTLVDGAHAPGMVPLALSRLGAAYYTGNAHKWLCAPKGAAFLHVRRDRQAGLHPTVISHGYRRGFQAQFDWAGTADPTAWLCIPESIRYRGRAAARRLARSDAGQSRAGVARACTPARASRRRAALSRYDDRRDGIPTVARRRPAPSRPGSTAPACKPGFARAAWRLAASAPRPVLRLSAQLYNVMEHFEQLAQLLLQALRASSPPT